MSTESDKNDNTVAIEHVAVDSAGRIELPATLRERFRIKTGDKLSIAGSDDGMIVRTIDQSIKAAQEYFKSLAPRGVSLSEELIEERCEEARQEDEEFRKWKEASSAGRRAKYTPTAD
jgi:AbrB family looped-hinge helix DNA binding protein